MSLIEEALRKIEEQHESESCSGGKRKRGNSTRNIFLTVLTSLFVCVSLWYGFVHRGISRRLPASESPAKKERVESPPPAQTDRPDRSDTGIKQPDNSRNLLRTPSHTTPAAVLKSREHSSKVSVREQFQKSLGEKNILVALNLARNYPDSLESQDFTSLVVELEAAGEEEKIINLIPVLEEKNKITPDIYIIAARILEEKNRLEEAVLMYRKALLSGMDNPKIFAKIGAIYDKLGEKEKAIKYYRKYLQVYDDESLKISVERRLNYLESEAN